MRKVLIISPHFPPLNAADMQRIRMSLPYFSEFGWYAELVTVDPDYSEVVRDDLLLQSVPTGTKVHKVKAFHKKWTSKFGLGSLALRSLWFYYRKVNQILKKEKFDLVYFSTTEFPVCILGAGWKKRFNIPYVIDMQDPWHSDYYRDKPREQQPKKYWFSYRMNKYLEPIAMKQAGGLISVSENYVNDLKARYPVIRDVPASTITFGAFAPDMEIAEANRQLFKNLLDARSTNIVYIGRGGKDMHQAISVLFKSLEDGLVHDRETFKKVKLYFIGTSYAPNGQGKETVMPLAKQLGIEDSVIEITDRISYYHTLVTLQEADALFIPGSDDPKYTASKIYPYLLTNRPLLAIFNSKSSVVNIMQEYGIEHVYCYDLPMDNHRQIQLFLKQAINNTLKADNRDAVAVIKYSAKKMTAGQCQLFDMVIDGKN